MAFTVASAHIDFRATRTRQLNAGVARRPAAISPNPRPFPFVVLHSGQTQAPVTDDAGAEKWCGLHVVEAIRQTISEGCGRGCVFCVASTNSPASEHRFV